MNLQQVGDHSYGPITINGGRAHLGDQYVNIYSSEVSRKEREWHQFLTSLRFPEINARLNEITDTPFETFEWVFNESVTTDRDWSSLTEWLKFGSGVYLIKGKAGSGKSTFMKFLYEHQKTRCFLQQCFASERVILLFHSFWLVGTKLQHSWKGFLASLMFHLVSTNMALLRFCDSVNWRMKHTLSDWSEKELRDVLLNLLRFSACRYCMFIDGLDELDHEDDISRFYDLIQDIEQPTLGIKYCISTRPVQHILDYLKNAPQLQLQNLTKQDIRSFVQLTLRSRMKASTLDRTTSMKIEAITLEICEKADGVFLWVQYVLRNVCCGLRVGDDLNALLMRIKQLPSAIEDLYLQMWRMHNANHAIHAREATRIFDFGKHFPMPVFQLTVALNESLTNHYLTSVQSLNEAHLSSMCEKVSRLLCDRSAGFIECVEASEMADNDLNVDHPNFWGPKGVSAYHAGSWRRTKVQYIHRTVHDFLTGSQEGLLITRSDSGMTPENIGRRWLQSYLACFVEDIRGFSVYSVTDLCRSQTWASLREGSLIDVVDKVCNQMVRERVLGTNAGAPDWFTTLYENTDHDVSVHYDFPGMIAGTAPFCSEHILRSRGKAWSAYYKGYLALCAIVSGFKKCVFSRDEVTNMLQVLDILKSAGADLVSLHPHVCSHSVLAVRSPAVRLLMDICVIFLQHTRRMTLSCASNLLQVLDALDLSGQELTIFWEDRHGSEAAKFFAHGIQERSCMLTFDAGLLHTSIVRLAKQYKRQTEVVGRHCDYLDDTMETAIREHFRRICANMPKKVHVCDISRTDPLEPYGIVFAACSPWWEEGLNNLIFRHQADEWNVYWKSFLWVFKPDFHPPISDLDFRAKEEFVTSFFTPLDPHQYIGPHDWKIKGVYRDYYASLAKLESGE